MVLVKVWVKVLGWVKVWVWEHLTMNNELQSYSDDLIYKHALTFSHEELAGMYAIINKREQGYLKEIKSLRLILQSHGEIVEINAELKKENARLLKNYDSVKSLLKDLCDEWDEDCEESCDGYGHDEMCRSVNLIQAKTSLNEQIKEVVQDNNRLEKENTRLREALEFYADRNNCNNPESCFIYEVDSDGDEIADEGYTARQALKGIEE
jgi:regulator of replication initiation timing